MNRLTYRLIGLAGLTAGIVLYHLSAIASTQLPTPTQEQFDRLDSHKRSTVLTLISLANAVRTADYEYAYISYSEVRPGSLNYEEGFPDSANDDHITAFSLEGKLKVRLNDTVLYMEECVLTGTAFLDDGTTKSMRYRNNTGMQFWYFAGDQKAYRRMAYSDTFDPTLEIVDPGEVWKHTRYSFAVPNYMKLRIGAEDLQRFWDAESGANALQYVTPPAYQNDEVRTTRTLNYRLPRVNTAFPIWHTWISYDTGTSLPLSSGGSLETTSGQSRALPGNHFYWDTTAGIPYPTCITVETVNENTDQVYRCMDLAMEKITLNQDVTIPLFAPTSMWTDKTTDHPKTHYGRLQIVDRMSLNTAIEDSKSNGDVDYVSPPNEDTATSSSETNSTDNVTTEPVSKTSP